MFWGRGAAGFFTVLLPGKIIQVVCESPVEARTSEDVESALQTVDLSEEGEAAPGPAEVKIKQEDRKPSRTSLRAFFRQMVSCSLLRHESRTSLHPTQGLGKLRLRGA